MKQLVRDTAVRAAPASRSSISENLTETYSHRWGSLPHSGQQHAASSSGRPLRSGATSPPTLRPSRAALPTVVADAARFAYLTLWRGENVLGLLWPWVATEWTDGEICGGVIRLPGHFTKNGRPLTVVLRGRLLDIIRRRWTARVDACTHVFHRNGKPLRDFRGAWEKATQAAGLVGASSTTYGAAGHATCVARGCQRRSSCGWVRGEPAACSSATTS